MVKLFPAKTLMFDTLIFIGQASAKNGPRSEWRAFRLPKVVDNAWPVRKLRRGHAVGMCRRSLTAGRSPARSVSPGTGVRDPALPARDQQAKLPQFAVIGAFAAQVRRRSASSTASAGWSTSGRPRPADPTRRELPECRGRQECLAFQHRCRHRHWRSCRRASFPALRWRHRRYPGTHWSLCRWSRPGTP